MKINRIVLVIVVFAIGLTARAQTAGTLSGSYRGTVTFMPKDGVTPYKDTGATLVIRSDPGKAPVAVVTYSAQLGRWQETCTITPNADGTITLQGVSWKIISGSSFSPDTFTVRVDSSGKVTGTSTDTSGGTTTVSFHPKIAPPPRSG